MSNGKKVAVVLWTFVVLIVAGGYLSAILETRTYSGGEVFFTADSGWNIGVNSVNPIRIEAATSTYFQFVQGETYMYGVPETPPLGYTADEYFHLDGQLQKGRWEVVKGYSISIELTEEEPFSVTYSPTSDQVTEEIVFVVIIGFLVWLVGVLIGKLLTTN